MGYEKSSLEAINLSAGQMIGLLEDKIQAGHAIEDGGENGLIQTLDMVTNKVNTDQVDGWIPGRDLVQNLNIQATIASKRPKANQGHGLESPARLHMIAEYGERYSGSTGNVSLMHMARLTVAMAAITAEKNGIPLDLHVVSDDPRKKLMISEKGGSDSMALHVLKAYDGFISDQKGGRKVKKGGLSSALEYAFEDVIDTDSDVCVVMSDFLSGVKFNRKGNIDSYNWAKPLNSMSRELGDRLFVARLVSPAQANLPLSPDYQVDGESLPVDFAGYLEANQEYERLAEESEICIQGVFKKFDRPVTELSATTKRPFIDISDMMLGAPVK